MAGLSVLPSSSFAQSFFTAFGSIEDEVQPVFRYLATSPRHLLGIRRCAIALGMRDRHCIARILRRHGLPPYSVMARWIIVLRWLHYCSCNGRTLGGISALQSVDHAHLYRLVKRVSGMRWSDFRSIGWHSGVALFKARCQPATCYEARVENTAGIRTRIREPSAAPIIDPDRRDLLDQLRKHLHWVTQDGWRIIEALVADSHTRPKAEIIATRAGIQSTYLLDRCLKQERLPPYRRLTPWLAVLRWTCAKERGISLCALTLGEGLDPASRYRTAKRILRHSWSEGVDDGLDNVIQRFAHQYLVRR